MPICDVARATRPVAEALGGRGRRRLVGVSLSFAGEDGAARAEAVFRKTQARCLAAAGLDPQRTSLHQVKVTEGLNDETGPELVKLEAMAYGPDPAESPADGAGGAAGK